MFLVKETVMFHGRALNAIVVGKAKQTLAAAQRALERHERGYIVNADNGRIVAYGKAGPAACLGIG